MQRSTGSGGYFAHAGSVSPRSHIENVEPRPERTIRWCAQVPQSPVGVGAIGSQDGTDPQGAARRVSLEG